MGGSVGVYASTEIVKAVKRIPINSGDTVKLRATAAVLSAVAVLLFGLISGNLTPESVQDVIIKLMEFGLIWLGSHKLYQSQK